MAAAGTGVFTLKNFYQAFEAQHRGSRDLIKERLTVYLPFVKQLQTLYPQGKALDLGCGRGEWLELLTFLNIQAHGIDLNDDMLHFCRELGLSVTTGEIIANLKTLPNNSHMLVSGFHIAEHLTFDTLQTLIREALRILKPAGLLILETPNPENLVVGTANFYIDPTHQRPLPQPLLAFLPEFHGFCRTKLLRLQESPTVAENQAPTLFDVLNGASPDYAIIAQKKAKPAWLTSFDGLFAQEFGISMETLAIRYENNIRHNFTLALQYTEQRLQATEAQLAQQRAENQQLTDELTAQKLENQRLLTETAVQKLENQRLLTETAAQQATLAIQISHLQQLEAQLTDAKQALQRYASSWSWRLTLPLRLMTRPLRPLARVIKKSPKALLEGLELWIQSRPALQQSLKKTLRRYPALYRYLLDFKTRYTTAQKVDSGTQTDSSATTEADYALTPAARKIYLTLKQAIAN